jgi:hypothetical protein
MAMEAQFEVTTEIVTLIEGHSICRHRSNQAATASACPEVGLAK